MNVRPPDMPPVSGPSPSTAPSRESIDWSQLWYPGPTRVFTAAELARAQLGPPSRTLVVMVAITVAVVAQAVLQHAPASELARLSALLLAACLGTYRLCLSLWWEPSRKRLMRYTLASVGVYALLTLGLKWRVSDGTARDWLFGALTGCFWASAVALWFVAVYRAHQIASRLRELDERDRALALQRQLATAQIQPHFLFNSLASLQHWVDTRDDRAGPLLASLTGYLRATLPLFERSTLTLGEELDAVRRYLEVMTARLGQDRLAPCVDAATPETLGAAVPPGLLLTLVENAVEHGAAARLSGGTVAVRVQGHGGRVWIEVVDNGPGLAEGAPGTGTGGLGLANTRARLAQVFGDEASLELFNGSTGGCTARVTVPLRARESSPGAPAAFPAH